MAVFQTCCRCAWPLLHRVTGRAALKKNDDDEEQVHLLANVVDSDDEQANRLSADDIKRYLDESRCDECSTESSMSGTLQMRSGGCARGQRRGSSPSSSSGPGGTSSSQSAGGSSAGAGRASKVASAVAPGPLVDEMDDIFDDDFEDEPARVVVGAKGLADVRPVRFGSSGSSPRGPQSPRDLRPPPQHDSMTLMEWLDTDEATPAAVRFGLPSGGPGPPAHFLLD